MIEPIKRKIYSVWIISFFEVSRVAEWTPNKAIKKIRWVGSLWVERIGTILMDKDVSVLYG